MPFVTATGVACLLLAVHLVMFQVRADVKKEGFMMKAAKKNSRKMPTSHPVFMMIGCAGKRWLVLTWFSSCSQITSFRALNTPLVNRPVMQPPIFKAICGSWIQRRLGVDKEEEEEKGSSQQSTTKKSSPSSKEINGKIHETIQDVISSTASVAMFCLVRALPRQVLYRSLRPLSFFPAPLQHPRYFPLD